MEMMMRDQNNVKIQNMMNEKNNQLQMELMMRDQSNKKIHNIMNER